MITLYAVFLHAYYIYFPDINKQSKYFLDLDELNEAMEFADSLDKDKIYMSGKNQMKTYVALINEIPPDEYMHLEEGKYVFKFDSDPDGSNAYIYYGWPYFDISDFDIYWIDDLLSVYY